MIVKIEVRNRNGELEYEWRGDTARQGRPEVPTQVLIKAAVNGALADIIDWTGRDLTIFCRER